MNIKNVEEELRIQKLDLKYYKFINFLLWVYSLLQIYKKLITNM